MPNLPRLFSRALRRRAIDADGAEALLRRLFEQGVPVPFAVRLWDGRLVSFGRDARLTLGFSDVETFRQCVGSGDPARFAEAFVDGRLAVEGEFDVVFDLMFAIGALDVGWTNLLKVRAALGVPPSTHSATEDSRDVRAHYDLSDDFFRLFLDERMVYSCAYFAGPGQSLEDAQARKLDLICRKLRLQPSDTLLDIGCGWGALLIWAATHYGVRAHGITLSPHQAAEARRRVEEAGLASRVTIEERHYEDLPAGAFDKIASIGMYEHVGESRLGDYVAAVTRALRAPGLFLNHGITTGIATGRTGGAFVFRHVFPGAAIHALSAVEQAMEACGLEVVDVESLRPHYALTLREWCRRFRAARDRAAALVPARTLRVWDLYLAGCARAFEQGFVNVHQVLAARSDAHGDRRLPLTRRDLLMP